MEDLNNQDENQFTQDQVDKIAFDTAESVLGGEAFLEEKVNGWANDICEKIIVQLTSAERSYKYMANCLI